MNDCKTDVIKLGVAGDFTWVWGVVLAGKRGVVIAVGILKGSAAGSGSRHTRYL